MYALLGFEAGRGHETLARCAGGDVQEVVCSRQPDSSRSQPDALPIKMAPAQLTFNSPPIHPSPHPSYFFFFFVRTRTFKIPFPLLFLAVPLHVRKLALKFVWDTVYRLTCLLPKQTQRKILSLFRSIVLFAIP